MNEKENKENPKEPLLKNEINEETETIGYLNDAYNGSNFLSKLFFIWSYRILKLAKRMPLKIDYLGTVDGENNSKNYSENVKYFWENKNYKSKPKNGLFLTILRAAIWRILCLLLMSAIIVFLEFCSVIFIKLYIDYFQYPNQRQFTLFQLGIAFISCKIISIFLNRQLQLMQSILGFKSSLELTCFIFDKVLKVSPSSFNERSGHGEIINFIQVDSPKLGTTIVLSPTLLLTPIQIIIYIYMLFNFFGFSFLFGLAILIVFIAINFKIYSNYRPLQKKMLEKKDSRMKITSETFDSLKLLKLYNWENEFKRRILETIIEEIAIYRKILNITVINIFFYWTAPMLASIATIGVYQYVYSSMNIGNILIGLAIFNMLQPAIRDLPITITSILETIISMRRIEKFLKQDEIDLKMVISNKNSDIAIKIDKGDFTWGSDPVIEKLKNKEGLKNENLNEQSVDKNKSIMSENNINDNESILINNNSFIENKIIVVLKNIKLEIKKGEVVGIIGKVSSGKSSLLQAILNNLIYLRNNHSSSIEINGSISYVSQIPWIQNDTLKNNILFFKEYDEKKYQQVINICQLRHDIGLFERGDNTEIGEKGINLSGGQKARVSLARAIYAETDIYIMDDPISALDAHVGKRIMKDCILKYLKNSTVLLVTHALQYLKYLDRIIYVSEGEIKWSGNYSELQKSEFFQELSQKLPHEKYEEIDYKDLIDEITDKKVINNEIKRITVDEEQETGMVKLSVYLKYFKYMGGFCFSIMIMIIMFVWQVTKAGSDYWLAFWSSKENQSSQERWIFFAVYSTLGITSSCFIFFRIFLLARGTIKLTINLHKDMLDKLIDAPINLFHDTIPRGRIFNRLSKDLETIRTTLYVYGTFLVNLFSVAGSIVICAIFQLYSLVPFPILFILGYFLTNFYIKGIRDLSRLDGISRSPVLNTLAETISGAMTIRAYKYESHYLNKFFENVNDVFKVNLFWYGCSNWYAMQIDFLALSFIILLSVFIIVFENQFSPQSIGLMLTYSITLQNRLFELFNMGTYFENNMVSMERCLEYTKIESEKEFDIKSDEILIKQKWPGSGKIEFKNYSVKYRPTTELVLKDINLIINGGEKIGIVGRTGSGKSTICLSLFRILEPFSGTILIDDVDISQIGLNILRQNITIIPQDPSLMKGTLKYNIDPFDNYSNDEVLNVLNMIGFNTILVNRNEEGLERIIGDSGENLSVGEKQLICIARAILRKSKIVVMDEATANIDIKTEEIIQKAIHEYFYNKTIITIAHRIKTILNYDKIVVLQDGQMIEFDTPTNLIHNKTSKFYEFYSKSSF